MCDYTKMLTVRTEKYVVLQKVIQYDLGLESEMQNLDSKTECWAWADFWEY